MIIIFRDNEGNLRIESDIEGVFIENCCVYASKYPAGVPSRVCIASYENKDSAEILINSIMDEIINQADKIRVIIDIEKIVNETNDDPEIELNNLLRLFSEVIR